jgi:hypothetical protein
MEANGNTERRQDCVAFRARGGLKLPASYDWTLRAQVLNYDEVDFPMTVGANQHFPYSMFFAGHFVLLPGY